MHTLGPSRASVPIRGQPHYSCKANTRAPCNQFTRLVAVADYAYARSTLTQIQAEPPTKTTDVASTSGPSTVDSIRHRLNGQDLQNWCTNCETLSQLGLDPDEVERLMGKAFGWTSQAFWRQEKVEEVPGPSQVQDVLSYLQSLGILDQDLCKVVKSFPEVVACSVDERLKVNVAKLEGEWRLKDAVLSKAVVRKPQILGYSVDCVGDCIGECNRCWVRF